MKLVIISGRSGSGKSTALNVLEDAGYYTIDNLPASLLLALVQELRNTNSAANENLAVCIDVRSISPQLEHFPSLLKSLPADIQTSVIYLDAQSRALIQRFSETRRRHPLSDKGTALQEALIREREILQPVADSADITIDTSQMQLHDLRDYMQQVVLRQTGTRMAILFQSFGFKKGLPLNIDLLWDLRCLPNPHWVAGLRNLSGADAAVVEYLEQHAMVQEMFEDICSYLDRWLPRYEFNNRPYTTIGIGCTGGQHRSVYMAERLGRHFASRGQYVQIRHRELELAPR